MPSPEHRRVKFTTGTIAHPTPAPSKESPKAPLRHLGTSRPFTRQVDVIFSSSDEVETALAKLDTQHYSVGQVKLADIVDPGGPFVEQFGQPEKWFTILSRDAHSDDVWCIDPRGLLTLLVEKDTYQRLGLIGKKLPFKGQSECYVIRLPLRKNAESVANQTRRYEMLKAWDERREREGLGAWNVLYSSSGESTPPPGVFTITQKLDVTCQVTQTNNVHIPIPSLRRHPSTSTSRPSSSSVSGDDEDQWILEDYHAEMAALFEWVGMACLGSQRLKANDRVDPYIAVYERPTPSYVGSLTHLRWSGFINPAFLQSVIDAVLASMTKTTKGMDHPRTDKRFFVALTAQAHSSAPVSYIPPPPSTQDSPVRLARSDGEDTWSLFAMPGLTDTEDAEWTLVESLGQYDTRWG